MRTKKVLINKCYGGFELSKAVYEALIARGWSVTQLTPDGNYEDPTAKIVDYQKSISASSLLKSRGYNFNRNVVDAIEVRTNTDLIQVVEELGVVAARGRFASLKIVEIPDDVEFEIEEYDGMEHVAEKHRTWG